MRLQKYDKGKIRLIRQKNFYKCEQEFTEFLNMNVECAKCIFGDNEYVSAKSAYNAFHKAVKRFGFPIKIVIRKDEIFFIRTDM